MKRILLLFAAITLMLAAMAQAPGITLSSGGKLQYFASHQLGTALEAAQPNDTIFLSAGSYDISGLTSDPWGYKMINKSVVIVGVGSGDIEGCQTVLTGDQLSIGGNGIDVTFIGIRYTDENLNFRSGEINSINLKNCYIANNRWSSSASLKYLNLENTYMNVLYCESTEDIMANNCIIRNLQNQSNNSASFIHCNIENTNSEVGYFLNSLIGNCYNNSTLENCYYWNAGSNTTLINSTQVNQDVDFDTIMWDKNYVEEQGWLGNDGTPVGIYGGIGFSLNPSVPTPNPAESSVTYDADEKKLKIKVSVLGE